VGPSPAFLGAPSQSLFTSDEIISQRSATKASKSAFAHANREGDGSALAWSCIVAAVQAMCN